MLNKLYSIRPAVWSILTLLAVFSVASAVVRSTGFIPAKVFMYVVQPVTVLAIAGVAYYFASRMRPIAGVEPARAYLVGGVVAIWLVLYFLGGLITTYVHNS